MTVYYFMLMVAPDMTGQIAYRGVIYKTDANKTNGH